MLQRGFTLSSLATAAALSAACAPQAYLYDRDLEQEEQVQDKGLFRPPSEELPPEHELEQPGPETPPAALGVDDSALPLLSPWLGRGEGSNGVVGSQVGDSPSPSVTGVLTELPAALAPSGLYSSGRVADIRGPEELYIRVAATGWGHCATNPVRLFRLYRGELETTAAASRTIGVVIDADIPSADDANIVEQLFRSWAALPPELRADPLMPTLYELHTKEHFGIYTIGSRCDAQLNEFTRDAVVTPYNPWYFETNPHTGAPGVIGIFWHEAAGHLVADAKPGTCNGPVQDEPYMTLYSHRSVLGWQEREVSADRMTVYLGALWVDAYRSDPAKAEPAAVPRRMLKCGFPRNHTIMEGAFDWMDDYFADVSCAGYFHPVPVINGHFAQAAQPDDVAIYGDSGQRTTCLVNSAGLDSPGLPDGAGQPAVVAQRLPNGVLACSAVCTPNGYVQDIYGFVAGNARACIPIEQCFGNSIGWYNSIQDFCEFDSGSYPARNRCSAYFGGRAVTLEGEPRRCMSPLLCEQSWNPPQSIGYGFEVDGDVCRGPDSADQPDPDSDSWI